MPTSPELVARLEWAEAAALLSCYAAAERAGGPPGAHAQTVAGVAVTAIDSIDAAFFNRAIGLGSVRPASASDVTAIADAFHSLSRKQSLLHLPNEVATPELEGWLAEAGYRRSRNWVKLWHALQTVPEARTSLRIERIGRERADAFEAITLEVFEFPPDVGPLATACIGADGWHHYVGFDGDTPVSVGAMFVDGETAWCGFGGTLEAARGRGGQSAMFAARLRDARDAGCTLVVTETGEETDEEPVNHSYRNMRSSGFALAYARPNWVRIEA